MEKCPLAENGSPGQEEYLERVLVGSRQCGGLLNSDVNLSNREDPGKAPALYFGLYSGKISVSFLVVF